MSHFTKIKTRMRDVEALADALRELYPNAIVDQRDRLTINGYRGRLANGVVAVRTAGAFGTDIGFQRNADGTLSRIEDAYTMGKPEHQEAARRLPHAYAVHQAMRSARAHGFQLIHRDDRTVDATVGR